MQTHQRASGTKIYVADNEMDLCNFNSRVANSTVSFTKILIATATKSEDTVKQWLKCDTLAVYVNTSFII